MKRILIVCVLACLAAPLGFGQVESVPLYNDVYPYLKEMSVKGIIGSIHDESPNLTRAEVRDFLKDIEAALPTLGTVEQAKFKRFAVEFYDEKQSDANTSRLIGGNTSFGEGVGEFFTDKVKYLGTVRNDGSTLYFEGMGHFLMGQQFEPRANNTELFDIGFRIRGTVLDHIGYSLYVLKGGLSGPARFAALVDPRLKYNFKFNEDIENIGNYDFTEAYLRYHVEPKRAMTIDVEIGREAVTSGLGFGSKMVLTGEHPTMDFIRFDFRYGIVRYESFHGSTVGNFEVDIQNRYTKYYAMNRLTLAFPHAFDIGIGEGIVYARRGIELAYMIPTLFYKFAEMELQDRDNGVIYFDLRTNCWKNVEIQSTFFLDEDILSNLSDLSRWTNKTGYQIGAMWYEPAGVQNLSLVGEYTRIRPFTYSHKDSMLTYTSWNTPLGHRIGPNADEIMLRATYNVSAWMRGSIEYRHVRSGKNVYDALGNLVKNVGGDIFQPHRDDIDPMEAVFLDGIRINNDILIAQVRWEPVRQFTFDLGVSANIENNVTTGGKNTEGYGFLRFTLGY